MFVKLHFCKMQAQQKSKLNNPAYGGRAFALRHTFPEAPQGKTDNLMDYTPDKNALLKAQWDLIHNPENVQFAWTEDMEEGAMVNIFSLIDDIRKANSNEERILTVTQDKCPSGHYKNVKLGENRLSLLQINCTSDFENAKIDETITSTWREWKPKLGSKIVIKPIEKAQVFAESTYGNVVYYQFHELKTEPVPVEELTDNLMFEFAVLEKEKHIFEEYLYPNEHNVNVTWVSQFDKTLFGDCSCYSSSCCFYASQYIVKSSTGLYSPNGNQIAIMEFPVKNEPLISMQTPVPIPDGLTQGVKYINSSLAAGKPVVVGVYYRERQEKQLNKTDKARKELLKSQENVDSINKQIEIYGKTEDLLSKKNELEKTLKEAQEKYNKLSQEGPFNSVEPTFHYLVVVGKGYDAEQKREYYRFFDVGVGTENQTNGTHDRNRLYIYNDKLVGSRGFDGMKYTVTEVRRHSKTGKDCTK